MPPETVSAGSRDSGLNAGAPRVSDTLVKAIRVGVQNSPKVSMRADPGQFSQASTGTSPGRRGTGFCEMLSRKCSIPSIILRACFPASPSSITFRRTTRRTGFTRKRIRNAFDISGNGASPFRVGDTIRAICFEKGEVPEFMTKM
jgi:hypothetical protein